MTEHPYRGLPARAFWSRSVSSDFDASALTDGPVLREGDRVGSAGSCFASNLVPWIERAGFEYVRAERVHPLLAHLPENLGYRNFSAGYGNIYTARQFRQLLLRSLGRFRPVEDRWHIGGDVIDPFRPGLRYPAQSDEEFDALTAQHLSAVLDAVRVCTLFVFTLGLTEAWVSRQDGAVFPGAPGTIAGEFDESRHEFRNFSAAEVEDDVVGFVDLLREVNPDIRVVLTVSPVPLVATATDEHVLVASTYSKAVLRVAAQGAAAARDDVAYFPAFEIVTGPQAPFEYFEADRRNVSQQGVAAVMAALLGERPAEPETAPPVVEAPLTMLSRSLVDAECDEVMAES